MTTPGRIEQATATTGSTVATGIAPADVTGELDVEGDLEEALTHVQILLVCPDHGGSDLEPVRPRGWS